MGDSAIIAGFLTLLFLGQGFLLVILARMGREALNDGLDVMAKLAQTVSIHQKAPNVQAAVKAQSILEANQATLESAREAMERELQDSQAPKGRPTGFRAADGRVIKFMGNLNPETLSRIPKDRLVYD